MFHQNSKYIESSHIFEDTQFNENEPGNLSSTDRRHLSTSILTIYIRPQSIFGIFYCTTDVRHHHQSSSNTLGHLQQILLEGGNANLISFVKSSKIQKYTVQEQLLKL